VAVVVAALTRLGTSGRVVQGEFRPGGAGTEWCDAEVLRAIRRRSLAALRKEVEPVPADALARFIPAWQRLGPRAARGADGLLRAVEQLAGVPVPASALETLVLPSRVADYSPALLDELTLAGEVVWAGAGALAGADGWLALAPSDLAPLVLPAAQEITDPLTAAVRDALGADEAVFFRSLVDRVETEATDEAVTRAVWELVWAGWLTNDTLAPLRALLGSGRRTAHRRSPRPPRGRYGRYAGLAATGGTARPTPHGMAGRWSAVPSRDADPTRRALAASDALLDRYGIVTRGAVVAERLPGGFSTVYPVLKAAEEAGRTRRGYFVAGLGAAQFALPGAVDRLRAEARPLDARRSDGSAALVLAATDPANPYGAALPWPAAGRPTDGGRGHQPARKAGALVVLVDGACVLYVERGGRTLLSFSDDVTVLQPAADALALAVRDGALGKLQVERADGVPVTASALGDALAAAGFRPTPRGLRLRS
jgi:ATP-dependent Lhr-like helicase